MNAQVTHQWIAPTQVFDGRALRHDVAVRMDGVHVLELGPKTIGAVPIQGTLMPGFVDLQVNGGGGVMVNTSPTAEGLRQVIEAHHSVGTTAIMPTVITDAPHVLAAAVDAAIEINGTDGFIGLHIEGPHIALARRGTHAAEHIRPLDDHTLDCVRRLRAASVTVMITLAPEGATPDQISPLADMGAIVSLGHTDATAEDVSIAIRAGATCGTHLFNAMSPMIGRAPGAVGALINSECYTGIICDGHHVADDMIALAARARPRDDRMFLVSDAMATVAGPDQFNLYGQTITLKGGKLVNSEGSLAGAHVTQAQGVKRLVDHVGLSLVDALRMAITTPASCVGQPELAQLIGRRIEDVIVLSDDLQHVQQMPPIAGRTPDAAE